MDPLVLIIYILLASFFVAEGIILKVILRKEQSGAEVKYSWFMTFGLILSTVCLLVSFTAAVYGADGAVGGRFGPQSIFAAANWILCAVLIVFAGFRLKAPPSTYIFSATAVLLFLWVALGMAR